MQVTESVLHIFSSILAVGVIAGGMAGLGALLGGLSAGDRWVRGFLFLSWAMTISAMAVSPRTAFWAGVVLVALGVLRGAFLFRSEARTAIHYALYMLAGACAWLLPVHFYDTVGYHLGLPWTWMMNGSYRPIAHLVMSRFPLAGQTVYLIPVGLGLPEVAAGLHWLTFVISLMTAAAVARNLGAGRWSPLVPFMLVGCWHAVWIATVASVDHLLLLGIIVALKNVTSEDEGSITAWGLGLPLGLALGAKYQGVIPGLAVGLATLAFHRKRWRVIVLAALVAVCIPGPGLLRNLVQTGNPFYPLAHDLLGGEGWSTRDALRFGALVHEGSFDIPGMLRALKFLIVPMGGLGWWVLLSIPLAVVAVVKAGPGRRRGVTLTGTALVLGLAGWLATSQTTRYAVPLAAIIAPLAATGVNLFSRRRSILCAGLIGIGVLHGLGGLAMFMGRELRIQDVWLRRIPRDEWRHRVTLNDPLVAFRMCETLLPPHARILIVGEGRSWGCPRPHHVSSAYDLQYMQEVIEQANDTNAVYERLVAEGYTHVLINWGEIARLNGPGFQVLRWQRREDWAVWRHFLDSYTRIIWMKDGVDIRELAASTSRM